MPKGVYPKKIKPLADRYWPFVSKNGPVPAHKPELGPCWPWTGSLDGRGYGQISVGERGKKQVRTHRVAFFLEHGRWPKPFGLHRCDYKPCCNPAHIFEGNQTINMRDCAAKGRIRNGRTR